MLRLIGPLLEFELRRMARRRNVYAMRSVYLVVSLVMLWASYGIAFEDEGALHWFEEILRNPELIAAHADGVFFLVAIQCCVAPFLPARMGAGTIVEERQQRTLELLLTTDLSSREIILGKLGGQFAGMTFCLAGLPLFAFAELVGDLDVALVVGLATACGVTMVSEASLFLLVELDQPTKETAVRRARRVTFGIWAVGIGLALWLREPLLNLGCPIIALFWVFNWYHGTWSSPDGLGEVFASYVLAHALLSLVCCVLAIRRLRAVALLPTSSSQTVAEQAGKASARPPRPPVWDHALLWKEWTDGRSGWPGWLRWLNHVPIWVWITALLLAGAASYVPGTPYDAGTVHAVLAAVVPWIACLQLCVCAASAVGAFSEEKNRNTLDGLLLLPDRDELLFAKWLGAIGKARLCLGPSFLWLLALGVLTGGLHVLAALLLVLAWGVYAAFLAALGLCMSVSGVLRLRSCALTALAVLALGVGSCGGLAGLATLVRDHLPSLAPAVETSPGGLVPAMLFVAVTVPAGDCPWKAEELAGMFLGLSLYAALTWPLWRLARYRFRDLMGPAPRRLGSRP